MSKVAIIGGGAWGTALACVAARSGNETSLWCRDASVRDEINQKHTNSNYLNALEIEKTIQATTSLQEALSDAELVLLAVPAQQLSVVLSQFPFIEASTLLVSTCKGIHQETGALPSQTLVAKFPNGRIAALSGPSFASDVVQSLPTAVTIASQDIAIADQVCDLISGGRFRGYASDDIKGVELGGALKNVLALAVGAANGMQLGASAQAALIARGFAEISRLVVKLGGRPETLMGLSGLGDITLTCSTPQSRNFSFGIALGRGDNLEGLKLAEGAFTASVAQRIACESGVEMPITSAIVDVLEKRITAREAVETLLERPLKREA